jgi:hypothetical protein
MRIRFVARLELDTNGFQLLFFPHLAIVQIEATATKLVGHGAAARLIKVTCRHQQDGSKVERRINSE